MSRNTLSVKSQRPTLVGLLIDVSTSMGRDWKDRDGRKSPQIEVIKEALNQEAKNLRSLNSSKPNKSSVELFCVGMGFRRPMKKWQLIATAKNHEIPKGTIIESDVDEAVVCDILALSEIIPTEAALQEIEKQMDRKWSQYSGEILPQMDLGENVFDEFPLYLREALQATVLKRLDNGIRARLLRILTRRTVLPDSHWLNEQTQKLRQWKLEREEQIEIRSFNESLSYVEGIKQAAESIFQDNAHEYEKYIRVALDEFASQQVSRILELLTLGHPPMLVFEAFDEEKAFGLARQLYNHLEEDIRPRIARTRLSNRVRPIIAARAVGGRLDSAKVQTLAEETAHQVILGKLKPFVRTLVLSVFRDALKEKARERFYEWIDLSSSREVTRPIKDIANFLPDALEQEVYSGEFMFGAAPIYSALKKVSLRFTDKRYAGHRKALIMISDGEFAEYSFPHAARLLQRSGVTIVSLYISNNVNNKPAVKPAENQGQELPPGARMMFDMSSRLDQEDGALHALGKLEGRGGDGKRLFIQVNDAKSLEDVLDALLMGEQSAIQPGPSVRVERRRRHPADGHADKRAAIGSLKII